MYISVIKQSVTSECATLKALFDSRAANPYKLSTTAVELRDTTKFYIHDKDQTATYMNNIDESKRGTHIGQLKLFLCDLHAILMYFELNPQKKQENCVVVYAGAASGDHIVALHHMFPGIRWYLYDRAPFCDGLTKLREEQNVKGRVELIQDYFTDDTAAKWKLKHGLETTDDIVFLSDIWTEHRTPEDPQLQKVMLDQQKWCIEIKPAIGSLKFRAPYSNSTIEYLKGQLLKVPYAPVTCTELRLLVVGDAKKRDYDCQKLEQQMAWHNQNNRKDETKQYGKQFTDQLVDRYKNICRKLEILSLDLERNICSIISSHVSHANGTHTGPPMPWSFAERPNCYLVNFNVNVYEPYLMSRHARPRTHTLPADAISRHSRSNFDFSANSSPAAPGSR